MNSKSYESGRISYRNDVYDPNVRQNAYAVDEDFIVMAHLIIPYLIKPGLLTDILRKNEKYLNEKGKISSFYSNQLKSPNTKLNNQRTHLHVTYLLERAHLISQNDKQRVESALCFRIREASLTCFSTARIPKSIWNRFKTSPEHEMPRPVLFGKYLILNVFARHLMSRLTTACGLPKP
ncbi:hypothetical protein CEXT_779321 [Caerostris extrusa]|uniref:Maturase K n=1 Tax=Caerostris extrusa TaxID=172846 RepID=A0AAV4WZ27_CAEEX|nr:hypothetical protein CEXT_779321 [Caerostris extrusa]